MKAILAILLISTVAGCKNEPVKPRDLVQRLEAGNLSDDDLRVITGYFPGMTRSCTEKVRAGGERAMPKRTEDCFEMTPQRRWSGLWRAALEGSQFCPDEAGRPAKECAFKEGTTMTWLEPRSDYTPNGILYQVNFVGRRTARPGHFGAYGFYQHEIVVDRMISMKRVPER